MPSGIDFSQIGIGSDVQWPKRGRKVAELDPNLIQALQNSYTQGVTASLVVRSDRVKTLANTLTKAGRQLNMRIERHLEHDKPQPGFTTYHFRARVKNVNSNREN